MKRLSLVCVVWGLMLLSTAAMAGEPPDSLWSQTYGGSDFDECYCVQQTTDGGYVLAGMTGSFGVPIVDFWLVKTDADGNEEWTRTYGGQDLDFGLSVEPTEDGGFILAGRTFSYGTGNSDMWLIKTDSEGQATF